MELRVALPNRGSQVVTTDMLTARGSITMTKRGAMSDQDIHIWGDQLPFLPEGRAAWQVECHIAEPGLPGAAIEFNSLQGHSFVLQIDCLGQSRPACGGRFLKATIMIAGDDDLMAMRQGAKKIVEVVQNRLFTEKQQISRMDQNVAVRNLNISMEGMGIAQEDKSQFHGCTWRNRAGECSLLPVEVLVAAYNLSR
jgi:hypothetical protein